MNRRITAACLVVLISILTAAAQRKGQPSTDELIHVERQFAAASADAGMYKAFAHFAAADGIWFHPGPTNVRESLAKAAAGSKPKFLLEWAPRYSAIAPSGDLGFNNGPYTYTDGGAAKPAGQGFFFTVWKRQTDGTWRFLIDSGVKTPSFDSAELSKTPQTIRIGSRPRPQPGRVVSDAGALMDLDRKLLATVKSEGRLRAYLPYLDGSVLLLREGRMPATDRAAAEKMLADDHQAWTGAPLSAGMAASGDFGYTYGTYESRAADSSADPDKGYYLRVWTRTAADAWRIQAEVIMPRASVGQ